MNPQALLEQLRGLHSPPEPGWWPPAPGWWILVGLVLSILFLVIQRLRHWRQQQAQQRQWRPPKDATLRKQALQALDQAQSAFQQQGHTGHYMQAMLEILRRTAKTANPASPIPALSTPDLLQALDNFCQGELSRHQPLEHWVNLPYRAQPTEACPAGEKQVICLRACAVQWIERQGWSAVQRPTHKRELPPC